MKKKIIVILLLLLMMVLLCGFRACWRWRRRHWFVKEPSQVSAELVQNLFPKSLHHGGA